MKIAILAAGKSLYFPLLFDKPKCLYSTGGVVQLKRVIENAKQFVAEKDIIVVGGYKYKYIEKYLKSYYPEIVLKVNERYKEPAIYSFRKAIENEEDDIVFIMADESISSQNTERICRSTRKMAILCHDTYYYYSLGIIKLRKDILNIINDERYTSMNSIKEIYCYANQKEDFDGVFSINSGICLGYILIDMVRKVGKIEKIEDPIKTYKGEDIDFLHFNPKEEYVKDLDYFSDTDEYNNNVLMRVYSDMISDPIKLVMRIPGNIVERIRRSKR